MTKKEVLQRLKEPFRSQAIHNSQHFTVTGGSRLDEPWYGETDAKSVAEVIRGTFVWASTPEGGEYWLDVAYHIEDHIEPETPQE
jgi:hypothetical protein